MLYLALLNKLAQQPTADSSRRRTKRGTNTPAPAEQPQPRAGGAATGKPGSGGRPGGGVGARADLASLGRVFPGGLANYLIRLGVSYVNNHITVISWHT